MSPRPDVAAAETSALPVAPLRPLRRAGPPLLRGECIAVDPVTGGRALMVGSPDDQAWPA